jgi:hypothetical protein
MPSSAAPGRRCVAECRRPRADCRRVDAVVVSVRTWPWPSPGIELLRRSGSSTFLRTSGTRRPPCLGAYGGDVAVTAFTQGGLALWFLGRPDQARVHARYGLSLAEKSGRPFDRASALFKSAFLELLCGDAAAAADLASRNGLRRPSFPLLSILRGATLVNKGVRGLASSCESGEQRAASDRSSVTSFAHVATACGRAGRWDEGTACR